MGKSLPRKSTRSINPDPSNETVSLDVSKSPLIHSSSHSDSHTTSRSRTPTTASGRDESPSLPEDKVYVFPTYRSIIKERGMDYSFLMRHQDGVVTKFSDVNHILPTYFLPSAPYAHGLILTTPLYTSFELRTDLQSVNPLLDHESKHFIAKWVSSNPQFGEKKRVSTKTDEEMEDISQRELMRREKLILRELESCYIHSFTRQEAYQHSNFEAIDLYRSQVSKNRTPGLPKRFHMAASILTDSPSYGGEECSQCSDKDIFQTDVSHPFVLFWDKLLASSMMKGVYRHLKCLHVTLKTTSPTRHPPSVLFSAIVQTNTLRSDKNIEWRKIREKEERELLQKLVRNWKAKQRRRILNITKSSSKYYTLNSTKEEFSNVIPPESIEDVQKYFAVPLIKIPKHHIYKVFFHVRADQFIPIHSPSSSPSSTNEFIVTVKCPLAIRAVNSISLCVEHVWEEHETSYRESPVISKEDVVNAKDADDTEQEKETQEMEEERKERKEPSDGGEETSDKDISSESFREHELKSNVPLPCALVSFDRISLFAEYPSRITEKLKEMELKAFTDQGPYHRMRNHSLEIKGNNGFGDTEKQPNLFLEITRGDSTVSQISPSQKTTVVVEKEGTNKQEKEEEEEEKGKEEEGKEEKEEKEERGGKEKSLQKEIIINENTELTDTKQTEELKKEEKKEEKIEEKIEEKEELMANKDTEKQESSIQESNETFEFSKKEESKKKSKEEKSEKEEERKRKERKRKKRKKNVGGKRRAFKRK
ncbi:hypothetical protein ADUPG1_010610 [Aduncisulcus paluster]|uniref:Uncharacterized protein n=1 Tax=Aduncisulcus paluster TaxID=2918883 RepID=A0ABQ5JVR2_9EUKA|nr:hypothetical protein ADUPG1_010610 [Aduncisulcus paluster]